LLIPPKRLINSFSVLEISIVVEAKKGEIAGRELDLLLHQSQIEIVSLNSGQLEEARTAWRRFGKGNHHCLTLTP